MSAAERRSSIFYTVDTKIESCSPTTTGLEACWKLVDVLCVILLCVYDE